jgi:Tfp pilus assembly protein PilV
MKIDLRHKRPLLLKTQKGSVLIEALLASLIFALAAIGALGMIASSAKSSADLRMRMEAATFAEDIIGRMQADMGTAAANVKNYDTSLASHPAYMAQWLDNIQKSLPNSRATVTVTDYAGTTGAQAVITIYWTPASGTEHKYSVDTAMAPNQ